MADGHRKISLRRSVARSKSILMTTSGRFKTKPRYTMATLKRDHVFKVRSSLAEYVDTELNEQGVSVFYQRVYIFAKNASLNDVVVADEDELKSTQAVGSLISGDGPPSVNVTTDSADGGTIAVTGVQTTTTTTAITATPRTTIGISRDTSLADNSKVTPITATPSGIEKVTKSYKYQEGTVLTEEADATEESSEINKVKIPQRGFFEIFTERLQQMAFQCKSRIYTIDPLCGLFLYMGEYSMLMLESCEDMIGLACQELVELANEFWLESRVFHVEDKITDTYFDTLLARRIPAAYINEKFPTSTPNDEYLMGKQHIIIKDKIHHICLFISKDMRFYQRDQTAALDLDDDDSSDDSDDDAVDDYDDYISNKIQKLLTAPHISMNLPADKFRKLLPEVQRINLVLSSTRFYFTIEEFSKIYGTTPTIIDELSFFWPFPNNYVPAHIFRRTPFDINLLFGDYDSEKNPNEPSDLNARRVTQFSQLEGIRASVQAQAQAEAEAAAAEKQAAARAVANDAAEQQQE